MVSCLISMKFGICIDKHFQYYIELSWLVTKRSGCWINQWTFQRNLGNLSQTRFIRNTHQTLCSLIHIRSSYQVWWDIIINFIGIVVIVNINIIIVVVIIITATTTNIQTQRSTQSSSCDHSIIIFFRYVPTSLKNKYCFMTHSQVHAASYKHIEAETKWPPFSRRHFQMHFVERKWMNFA